MKLKYFLNSLEQILVPTIRALTLTFILFVAVVISSCGNPDAESQVREFCSEVEIGEGIMDVMARAGKVSFDKYWLEKFDKDPSKGKVIGIIRLRDLDKSTEKLAKLKRPKTWKHGQFKAMTQEFGYSRYLCSVDFARSKVVSKEVVSVD